MIRAAAVALALCLAAPTAFGKAKPKPAKAPAADPSGCPAPHGKPIAAKVRACGAGDTVSAKFDTKKPETLRSNLCKAQKDNAGLGVDFSLFGHNDGRVHDTSREVKKIAHVVVHNGGYTGKMNAETWDCRPAVSHYTIDRAGKIFQHIGEEKIGGHAGGKNSSAPHINNESIGIELNIGKHGKTSCNSLTIAKNKPGAGEIVKAACAPTDAQYASLKKLLKQIAARTSVKLDEQHVTGHCETQKRSGHGDPRAFDWSKIGMSNATKKAKIANTACGWYDLYD
jgi:N-acetyl-anhydromuramyl-L-alanine amidase AmpD